MQLPPHDPLDTLGIAEGPRAFVQDADLTLYVGDALDVLRSLPAGAADACVTSPPYLDVRPEYPSPTLDEFEAIFRELSRVVAGPALVNVGRIFRGGCETLWWVDLLRAAERGGWSLLDSLVWIKSNANPISGPLLANSHEHVLILGDAATVLNVDAARTPYAPSSIARVERGWTNHVGVKNVPSLRTRSADELHAAGARPRSFFTLSVGSDKGNAHPAPMALGLAKHLLTLASWQGQTVIDPFAGSGTTALAARALGRRCILIELDPDYAALAAERCQQLSLLAEAP